MSGKKTHKQYIEEVYKINPNINVIDYYNGSHTKIKHKCKICGHEWFAKPSDILQKHGCPKCAMLIRVQKCRKSHDKYVKEVHGINPDIEVVGEYQGREMKILHRCKIDGYEWMAAPHNILSGQNCPVCSGKAIGRSPEYKNSIWASEHREYFSMYLSEEQMKSYMPHSTRKIDVMCPNCGRHHYIRMLDLFRSGVVCICADRNSYPNKFMYNLLTQLKVEYIPEYSPEWSNGKKYDIFIPSLSCIIENHGGQHYTECTLTCRTLREEQENDKYKERLAKENGINNYIVIDCRESQIEFIKNSILGSCLPTLLSFNSKSINWGECDKFASSNLIKKASELWNEGLTTKDIANKFKMAQETIINYLKKAVVFGWCNYSKQESLHRKNTKDINFYNARKVVRLSDSYIYMCLTDAAKDNRINRSTMTNRCKSQKDFMYYDDWVNTKYNFKGE